MVYEGWVRESGGPWPVVGSRGSEGPWNRDGEAWYCLVRQ